MIKTTVGQILKINSFKKFKVLSGKEGLNRKVESITIIDSPEPYPHAKGGEILLTSGYIFKMYEENFVQAIIDLDKSGVAALFIKVRRYFDKIPDDVLAISEKLQFPIVEVPYYIAFRDVINPTLTKIISLQSEELKLSEKIHDTFTNLVVTGADVNKILKVLSKLTKKNVYYYDLMFQKLNSFSENITEEIYEKSLQQLTERFTSYKVATNSETYGYLLFDEEIDDSDKKIINHAATSIILDTQKRISSRQIEMRHKNEFVQDIIMNNIKSREEVYTRCKLYNWDFKNSVRVVCVDIDNFKDEYAKINGAYDNEKLELEKSKIINSAVKTMKSNFKNCVYATLSDAIVFLVQQVDEFQLVECCQEIQKTIKNNYSFTVTIGIGNVKNDLMSVYESYREAQDAIKVSRVLYSKDRVVLARDLGVFKLLLKVYEDRDVIKFSDEYLEKLKTYDKKNNSELLLTLEYIVESDWNLKEAAKKMFVHYNTLKYRYKKITELLGRDLSLLDEKLNITLALKISKMRVE